VNGIVIHDILPSFLPLNSHTLSLSLSLSLFISPKSMKLGIEWFLKKNVSIFFVGMGTLNVRDKQREESATRREKK
jgi:hypothetical protein